MDIKEAKRKLKVLNTIKKTIPKKTQERRDINKKIRELKKIMTAENNLCPEKIELIEKIYKVKPYLRKLNMDMGKFSIGELQYHYNKKCKGLKNNE